MPTNEQLAWVAGFWDGEGCVSTIKNYATPQFTLSQAGSEGEALCRRVLEWSGMDGRISGPYVAKNRPNWTPQYKVRITGYKNVKALADACWPWLSNTKRAQVEKVFARYFEFRITNNVIAKGERPSCPQGHLYDEENTRITRNGWRCCRRCHREDEARRNALKRAQSSSASTALTAESPSAI